MTPWRISFSPGCCAKACAAVSRNTSSPANVNDDMRFTMALAPSLSAEEVHDTGLEVVHRSRNLDRSARLQFGKHRAVLPDVADRELHVLARHRVYKRVVRGCALAVVCRRIDGGPNLLQETGQIPELGVVDGALDRPACRVAHDQNHFGTRDLAGELHTAKDVWILDIARHTAVEDVADAKIHDRLGRSPRVDAAQQHRSGILTRGAGALLCQEIAGL